MRNIFAGLLLLLGITAVEKQASAEALDYEQAIHLDAEALAEFGIKDAYAKLIPVMARHGIVLAPLIEEIAPNGEAYAVSIGSNRYVVFEARNLKATTIDLLWGMAASMFFKLVNDQLEQTPFRFYALNGGNDLMGMVLTPEQAEASKSAIDNHEDWPYFPEHSAPWYGQYHSEGSVIPWWVSVARKLKQ